MNKNLRTKKPLLSSNMQAEAVTRIAPGLFIAMCEL
jgi:hypothetical protein